MSYHRLRTSGLLLGLAASLVGAPPKRPNILIINADDLGYGDLGCYGATRIKTPQIDRLAKEGVRFTQAYATAATSTPSRYSLLTGEYPFRKEGVQILPGDAALILDPARTSLPSMLQKAGYRTGIVGKWHLGLGSGKVDWNQPVAPGPREVGFEHSFIMAATGDRVPCVFLENQRVVGLDPADPIQVDYKKPFEGEPDATRDRATLKVDWDHGHNFAIVNGIGRIGYMKGGQKARWRDEDMSDTFLAQAKAFVTEKGERPWFLYYAVHEPHVPRIPHPRFKGATELGPRGDVIVQFDDAVGQLMAHLKQLGVDKNTLVILTSDNGPVLQDGYKDDAAERTGSHKPAGPLRGGKYSAYDGGAKVPLLVRWPGQVRPGHSDARVCQMDFFASFTGLTGGTIPQGHARDSQDHLPTLLGRTQKGRRTLVTVGARNSLLDGPWKFIPGGSGQAWEPHTRVEMGRTPEDQLFRVDQDPSERRNLADKHPVRLKAMKAHLEAILKGQ